MDFPVSVVVAFIALIFFIVDKNMGILMALVLPGVVGLSTDGEYAHTLVVLLFAVTVLFVQKLAFERGVK